MIISPELKPPSCHSRSQPDVPNLREHIAKGYGRRPPDHLIFEWFAGESAETKAYANGRSFRIFRYNTFHHIGHISTLAQPKNRFAPGCYSLLYDWVMRSTRTLTLTLTPGCYSLLYDWVTRSRAGLQPS